MRNVLTVSVALSILVLAPKLVAGQHFLDLTAIKAAPQTATEGFVAAGGVRGVEGQEAPRLPLEVLLTWVNRGDLILGGQIVSEVQIKNVGSDAVSLPWSPTRQPWVDGDLAERRLFLVLIAIDGNGGHHPDDIHRFRDVSVCQANEAQSACQDRYQREQQGLGGTAALRECDCCDASSRNCEEARALKNATMREQEPPTW